MVQQALIRALKANPDALVTAVLSAAAVRLSFFNVAAGLALFVVGMLLHHLRRTTAEYHERKMARMRLDEQIVKLEGVRVRHGAQLTARQPELPFPGRLTKPAPGKRVERDR